MGSSAFLLLLPTVMVLLTVNPATWAASWSYGVDVYYLISEKTYECIYNAGYSVAFVRIYMPNGGGKADPNGKDNVLNALQANLGVEVFVQPAAQSTKQGYTQFNEAYKYMSDNKITIGNIWLLVTQPNAWSTDPNANVNFINSFITQAQSNNLNVGIYTNWYDWYLITGNYAGVDSSVMLWYWDVLGLGVNAETSQDFNDYRLFGEWTGPTVKQFGIVETVCGVTVNRDVFQTPSSKMALGGSSNTTGINNNPKQLLRKDRKFLSSTVGSGLVKNEKGFYSAGNNKFTKVEKADGKAGVIITNPGASPNFG